MTFYSFYSFTKKLITETVADDVETALRKAMRCAAIGLLPPGSTLNLHLGQYTIETRAFTGSSETAQNIREIDTKAEAMLRRPRVTARESQC